MTNYYFSYKSASTQYIDIEVNILTGGITTLSVQLPAWRPGRYELGNFAKNVKGFTVTNEQGEVLPFEKVTKDCWEVETQGAETITVKYSYYANQLNAGATWLDATQLYVNPVNCCVYAAGMENYPCRVEIDVPKSYQLACGEKHTIELSDTGAKLIFETEDFDRLADTPFIASATMQHDTYEVAGTLFHLWFVGESKPNFTKIKEDFIAFTAKQVEVMGSIPVKEYHFYFQILPTPYHHGVEHITSTVIALGPSYKLMYGELYDDFLGVSSHELFHVWNIKTIRPAEMLPYDFTGENYFTTGFVAEGVTTYYGDTFLMRSKVFTPEAYLALLADNVKRHYHNYARHNYSVAASGFDTWLDGYVPGAPNRKVSIYNEGCLLAFALDVQIRKHSNNQHSLDDVLRRLYADFGQKNRGYTADDYKMLAEVTAGTSFDNFFADYIFGTKPYNDLLNECFAYLGLTLVETPAGLYSERVFGFKYDGKVAAIAPQSPAENAGLMLGDSIVAVNGYTTSFNDWFNYFACETVKLTVNTAGVLRELLLHPGKEQYYPTYAIKIVEDATPEQKAAFDGWSS